MTSTPEQFAATYCGTHRVTSPRQRRRALRWSRACFAAADDGVVWPGMSVALATESLRGAIFGGGLLSWLLWTLGSSLARPLIEAFVRWYLRDGYQQWDHPATVLYRPPRPHG